MQPFVYSRIDLQPQAFEAHFLGFEIFKRYIERNVMECRLFGVQFDDLFSRKDRSSASKRARFCV